MASSGVRGRSPGYGNVQWRPRSGERLRPAGASASRRGPFAVEPRHGGSSSAVFQIFGLTMVGSGLILAWVFVLAFVL